MPGITPATPLNLGQIQQASPSQMNSKVVAVPTFVLTTPLIPKLAQSPQAQDPTKPWKDLDYLSQLPVVQTYVPVRFEGNAPCWGFDSAFNVGDLNDVYGGVKSCPILNVTANTTSALIKMGVNRIDITIGLSDSLAACNLDIYQVDTVNGNVLMKSYVGITRFTEGVFIGGHDQIMLRGAPVVLAVSSITNGATVSVNIQGH